MSSSENTAVRTLFVNDVTLRDGEQAPGNTMNLEEKLDIARQLVQLGIPGIEAGFPIASPGDALSVSRIAEEVGNMEMPANAAGLRHARISGLARLRKADIESVLWAVAAAPHRGVHTFISTSQPQMVKFEDELRRRGGTPGSMKDFVDKLVLPGIEENLSVIKQADPRAIIQFSPEDWTRTTDDVSDQVILAAAQHGSDIINLPDTVGIGIPVVVMRRVARVRRLLDDHGFAHVKISWHGHNDTGQGVANAIAAMHGGAEQFESTILGIGERTGNFSFEGWLASLDANREIHEQMMHVHLRDTLVRVETMKTAQLLAAILGIKIAREHPLVGENAFAHESGIHADGQEKGRAAGRNDVYEVVNPPDYGAKSKIILGKHSGRANIRSVLRENGLPWCDEDLQAMADALSIAGDERRKGLSDIEFLRKVYYPFVLGVTGGPVVLDVQKKRRIGGRKLVRIVLSSGEAIQGIATASDEGVVDAFEQGVQQIHPDVKVKEFDVHKKPMEEKGGSSGAFGDIVLVDAYEVSMRSESHNVEQAGLDAYKDAFNVLHALHIYGEMTKSGQQSRREAAGSML